MKKQHVQLSPEDKSYLKKLISKGNLPAKVFNRALALLELDKGNSYTSVSKIVNRKYDTLSIWAKKYKESGLDFLEDQARSGRPPTIDGDVRAKITALACTDAPKGHAKWTVRLLANKAVELGYCEKISKTTVGEILKKTN